MAAAVGTASTSLTLLDALFEEGWDFDFFQAVRLLEWLEPSRRIVIGLGQPAREAVRFGVHRSLEFPASVIHEILREGSGPISVTVAFLGLTGPQGALPEHYTEHLIWRGYEKDSAAQAFFNLFNHRFISLFYKAWLKHHFAVQFELEQRSGAREQRFTQYLFDLIGLGTHGLQGRLAVPDRELLPYSGLIAQYPHSAVALEGLLRDYFDVPVEIVQFQGRWVALEEENLSNLDDADLRNQLGEGAIAGDAVWNQRAAFRIRLGPLSYSRFEHFLPSGSAIPKLISIVRFFAGPALGFDLQLILRSEDVPYCTFSEGSITPRLGWTSWLNLENRGEAADDLILITVGDGVY